MDRFLDKVIAAHGGMERWRGYERVNATIVTGGRLLRIEGPAAGRGPPPDDGVAA